MNTTEDDVKTFLDNFKVKMQMWDVIFRDDRGKNQQTLADLGIVPNERKEVLKKLLVSDFSEGPKEDALYGKAAMWVFGRIVKKKEIYIKITMGIEGSSTMCISFHIAEHPMTYPFKNEQA